MTATDTDEFLAHFGVKGMKWGVIREKNSTSSDPGSTVKSGDTRSQVRQAKRDAKAERFDKLASSYDERLKTTTSDRDRRMLTAFRDQASRDATAVRNHKLTSNQKKIAVGAAVVGAIIFTAAASHYVNTGELARIRSIGLSKAFDRTSEINFPKNDKFASASTADEVFSKVVKGVNPHYGLPGTVSNCRRTAFAYEMRRRGLDVRATKTTNGYGQNVQGLINAITPGSNLPTSHGKAVKRGMTDLYSSSLIGGESKFGKPIFKEFSGVRLKVGIERPTAKDIFETLAQQPSASRGEFSLTTKKYGNHSMVYELFDGKPVIFDVQRNKRFDSPEAFEEVAKLISKAGFTRLDNKPLNTNYLGRWVTSSAK
jgi:hypothetical protein